MKSPLLLVFILICTSTVFAQKGDYKVLRDSITKLSCKPFDSITVAQANQDFKNLDISQFDTNLDVYYRDLAWSYYRLYMHNKDTTLLRYSIDAYKKADELKPDQMTTYWNMASNYFNLLDCETGRFYLNEYKRVADEKYWNEEQIKRMTMRCDD